MTTSPSRARGPWLVGAQALAWAGVAAWIWLTRAEVLLAGHPAYALTVCGAGLVGVLFAVSTGRRLSGRARAPRGPAWLRVLGQLALLAVGALVLASLIYLRPFSASAEARGLMAGTSAVEVDDAPTSITLTPRGQVETGALIFQPGARVDARAYLPLLHDVAEQGHLVAIVKQPFGIGFTALGAPASVIDDHPEVRAWATGGHSLGGVAASAYAADRADQVSGLLLWASYPLDDLSARNDLAVSSVSGSEDGLATPEDILGSRVDLPSRTTFVEVDGATHAFFGDYGDQPGDGIPTISRSAAQQQIVQASVELLRVVAATAG